MPTRVARRSTRRRAEEMGVTRMVRRASSTRRVLAFPKRSVTKLVELASARFVETHGGVLLIGPPGVGKSHVATAIAVGAITPMEVASAHRSLCAR